VRQKLFEREADNPISGGFQDVAESAIRVDTCSGGVNDYKTVANRVEEGPRIKLLAYKVFPYQSIEPE
jgi:hypothetical protein